DLRADSDGRLLVLVPAGKSAKAGFPRLDGEKDRDDAKGKEKTAAGVVKAEAGKPVELKAGKKNVIQLPVRRDVMTIAFRVDVTPDAEYPSFVLESDDGAYRVKLSPKDDLEPNDDVLELRFAGLVPGRKYTLVRRWDAEHAEVLFRDVPYSQAVDQQRP
ncbi:MAG: hypothetical protein WCC48_05400, partial [Anaeromyxobacteraceae bacterium]